MKQEDKNRIISQQIQIKKHSQVKSAQFAGNYDFMIQIIGYGYNKDLKFYMKNISENQTIQQLLQKCLQIKGLQKERQQQHLGININKGRFLYRNVKQLKIKKIAQSVKLFQSFTNKIIISSRLLGGGGPMFIFNSLDNKIIKQFERAPQYRTVSPGLTLLAFCRNQNCSAIDQQVCVKKGFGVFQLGEQIFDCKCPICGSNTQQAYNMGYYKTKIQVKGRKNNGQEVKYEQIVDKSQFTTFSRSDNDFQKWNFLKITTSPLK